MPEIPMPSRRIFFRRGVTGALVAFAIPEAALMQTPPRARPDPLPPDLVREFVQKAHADLPATRSLLAETPALLNATWDWGGGDFEMGIGGAGHMGNREIAEFLISKGARMDIFVAAMLGHLAIVKAMVAAYEPLLHAKGPHGIPLMAHAKQGGASAETVVAFLESRGIRS